MAKPARTAVTSIITTGILTQNYFNNNKCVSKTDTNPPFALQIAFPRGTDFTGFLQGGSKIGGSKIRDLQSEISVPIESRIESADSRLQLQCYFFLIAIYRTDVRIRQNYCAIAILGYYCACSNYKYMN